MISKLFVLKGLERSTTAVQESVFGTRELFGTLWGGETEPQTQIEDLNLSPPECGVELGNPPIENQKMMIVILQDNGCKRFSVSFELDLAEGGGGQKKTDLDVRTGGIWTQCRSSTADPADQRQCLLRRSR